MARLRASKQTLSRRRAELALYRRVLPSLDLKRRQLTLEHERARRALAEARAELARFEQAVGERLPMLADGRVHVEGLLDVRGVVTGEENLLGVRLPRLERIELARTAYARLAKPAWVDVAVEALEEAVRHRLQVAVQVRRVAALHAAMRRLTQRVNLFERVLIPGAVDDIKRIRIQLDDLEREAVIRSKIAKRRQPHAHAASEGAA